MQDMRITFRSFSYTYLIRGSAPRYALRDVTIENIRPMEIVCLAGPNGSGKSTFINCIAGRYRLRKDQGAILAYRSGKEFYNPTLKIAYIPQDPLEGMVPDMSIIENIALRKTIFTKGLFRKAVTDSLKTEIGEVLSKLQLDYLYDRLDDSPSTPSGGERQLFNVVFSSDFEARCNCCR